MLMLAPSRHVHLQQVGAFSSNISQILSGANGLEVRLIVGQPSPPPATFQAEEDGKGESGKEGLSWAVSKK